ncbi:ADP-ribosylglycohydrolase family protein [Ruminococcaceae bacterium OttesenSCG-928-I18]|nr:ADP-ribosylglycohydrolase family protein [Ruminococcaceae bacterium OttesenSCG-928-I18]
MLGAIIGDIVGSVYEWNNIKTKEFPLFSDKNFITDDTVMTIAVADALMNGGSEDDFIDSMKRFGRMYPDADYGARFGRWLFSADRKPYNSWGNGSAMRVSPCGWMMDCGFYARTGCWPTKEWKIVKISAAVTHNHVEGIKGAEATAAAIFLSRFYSEGHAFDYSKPWSLEELKEEMKKLIESNYGYDLSFTLDEIRPVYQFNESCQKTVPEAIIAFLESTDFEDAIRNAISLGGDSDTLAAITGSIAEAAYGIPEGIVNKALSYLTPPLREVYERWCKMMGKHPYP